MARPVPKAAAGTPKAVVQALRCARSRSARNALTVTSCKLGGAEALHVLPCSKVVLRVLQFRHARFFRCRYMDGRCATENSLILVVIVLALNRPLPLYSVERCLTLRFCPRALAQ